MTGGPVKAVLASALAALIAWQAPTTLAVLTDAATVASSADGFSTGSLATPAAPSVTSTGATSRTIAWSPTPVSTGTGSTTATGYRVLRYVGAAGGTGTAVCTTTTTTCTLTNQPLIAYYSVEAAFMAGWRAESGRTTIIGDTVGPALVVRAPEPGNSQGGQNRFQNNLSSACGEGVLACGSVDDPSKPITVAYTLGRQNGATYQCWNGTGWAPSTAATCGAVQRAATVSADTSTWRVSGAPATAYDQRVSYTLVVRATDAVGNRTTTTVAFSIG